jgi:hypothetical protein
VLAGKATTMKVHVLKVRGPDNLYEMEQGIAAGHTVGGWQMPKTAVPGDLAVWYAGSPDQDYRAWGWVVGFPTAGFRESSRLYMGPWVVSSGSIRLSGCF